MVVIITIYDRKETVFASNGLAVLNDCKECIIKEKLNNEYELTLSYPLSSKKAEYIQQYNVIKADGQLFRIYNTDKDSKAEIVTANARHIFYDLLNYMVEDKIAANITCQEAMVMMIQELGLDSIYSVESDITSLAIQSVVQRNGVETMFLLINAWQGELIRDNFSIKINTAKGSDKGVCIRYGKNVVGINETLNCDNVVTRIYPVGANGITLPEKYLTNDLWQNSDYPSFALLRKAEFSDAENEQTLRSEAQKYLGEHAVPDVNYKIDFIKLGQTEEYKNYKTLEEVEVGDIVTVKHTILGINIKVKVIGIEKDILSAKNTKVELGQPLKTIDAYIADLATSVVIKGKTYYGIRITEDNGFETIRSDKKARSVFNADGFRLQKGDGIGNWEDKLYADNEGNLILDGAISWDNVTDKPEGTDGYTDEDAIAAVNRTYIDGNGVWTPKVYAQNVVAGFLKLVEGMIIGTEDGTIKITKDSIEIIDGKIVIKDKSGQNTIINKYGVDTKFIKNFKNMVHNSQFELFDRTTNKPLYWSGTGVSDANSSFFGTVSLRLDPGKSMTTSAEINPQWYADTSVERTRVSFYRKNGQVRVEVLLNDNLPAVIMDEAGNEAGSIAYPRTANWNNSRASISFAHGDATECKIRFTNIDTVESAYIDAVQLEPDFTGFWPSFYTDGPNSLGDGTGKQIKGESWGVMMTGLTNSISVGNTLTLLGGLYPKLGGSGHIFGDFSIVGNASAALQITATVYLNGTVAFTYKQKIPGAGYHTISASFVMAAVPAGDQIIEVKLQTDTGTYTIDANGFNFFIKSTAVDGIGTTPPHAEVLETIDLDAGIGLLEEIDNWNVISATQIGVILEDPVDVLLSVQKTSSDVIAFISDLNTKTDIEQTITITLTSM